MALFDPSRPRLGDVPAGVSGWAPRIPFETTLRDLLDQARAEEQERNGA